MVVATPGRLNDMLNKRRMNLNQCMFLALDEADRYVKNFNNHSASNHCAKRAFSYLRAD